MIGMAGLTLAAGTDGPITLQHADEHMVGRHPIRLADRPEPREKSSGLTRMLKKSKRQ